MPRADLAGPVGHKGEWGAWAASAGALASACAILLVAYTLRLRDLNAWGLWYDEGHSAYVASLPLSQLMAAVSADVHPPLHFLALKAWMVATGESEFALRFLSVTLGVLTVALIYKLAELTVDRRAAVAAGLLATVSPLLVAYAQEARIYVMAGFLVTLAACLLVLAWRRQQPYLWLAFALAEAAALYTHYYTALVLLALGVAAFGAAVWTAARGDLRSRPLAWAGAQVAVLLVFAPWAPTALARLGAYGSDWMPDFELGQLLVASLHALNLGPWRGAPVDGAVLGLAAALAAAAALAGLLSHTGRKAIVLSLLWLGLTVGVVLYAALQQPMFHPRYLLQAAPAYCLLLGTGFSRGGRWAGKMAVALLLAAGGIFVFGLTLGGAFVRDDARGVAHYLAGEVGPRDVVLVDTDQPFRYYAKITATPYEILPTEGPGDDALRERLNRLVLDRGRAFHVQWHESSYDAKEVVKYHLRSQAEWLGERRFDGFRLDTYDVSGVDSFRGPRLEPLALSFEGVVGLGGAALGPGRDLVGEGQTPAVVAGGDLPVSLVWRLQASHTDDLAALLFLADERGHAVARVGQKLINSAHVYSARWRPGEENTNFYLLSVPDGTPPGEYTLKVFVHWAGTVQRVDLVDEAGRPQGTEAELGRVRVASPTAVGRAAPLPPSSVAHTFGDLSLVAATVSARALSPGESLSVQLDWWAGERPTGDYSVRLSLGPDGDGEPLVESTGQPAYGRYPTTSWAAGERVVERREVTIPGQARAGSYRVVVSLLDASGGETPGFMIDAVTVGELERTYDPPSISRPLRAVFGGQIELLGFDVSSADLHGDRPLYLTLYWRCLGEMSADYTVFTHLLGPGDVVWGQHDAPPLGGARPTAGWAVGEVLTDRYELTLRPGAPPGPYRLEIGWYDARTMERLPVLEADSTALENRVVLLDLDLPR